MKFCELMKQQRKKKKITQLALSELVGINKNSICRYERGEISPSLDVAQAIGKELDFDLVFRWKNV